MNRKGNPMPSRILTGLIMLLFVMAGPAAGAGKDLAAKARGQQSAAGKTEKGPSPNVLSIIPAQGEPETSITLSGSGFTEKTMVYLGNNEVPANVINQQLLTFEIPKLPSGVYALYLKNESGAVSRTYSFNLLPLKPVIVGISPDTIQACATDHEREVTISGQNFQPGSQVLFDGAVIRSRFLSAESISVITPPVGGGLHQIQVKNPEDTTSVNMALMINTRPEILTVSQGKDFVNYYELIIEGKNFQQGSRVVVMEERNIDQSGLQPSVDVKQLSSSTVTGAERDRTIYTNCTQIIYQRYPYSSTQKNFKLQVINPTGEESSVAQVSAP